jgi:hypothetical protein
MKKTFLALSLTCLSASSFATMMSCEDLKTKIETKLAGKGVKNYTLEVVEKNTATTDRVVGSCEGDKKKIIYHKVKTPKEGA